MYVVAHSAPYRAMPRSFDKLHVAEVLLTIATADWIDDFYNNERRHSYQTPRLRCGSNPHPNTARSSAAHSINRLLIEHKSPPDKRGEAIQLVTEQMEALVPHYVERRVEVA